MEQVKVSDQHPKADSIIRLGPEQNALTVSSAPGDAEEAHVGLRIHGLEVSQ